MGQVQWEPWNNYYMKLFKKSLIIILFTTIIIGGAVFAGQLTPTGAPGTSFVTLTDIYEKILDNTYATSSRDYEPSLAPAGTHYTLQQIFDIIPAINPELVISGNSILGVDGTYDVSNLTPDKVATGTVYGVGLVGTWEAPVVDHYLLEGFGDPNTNGRYFDIGLIENGRRLFVNENGATCIAYFDVALFPQSAGWATANYPMIGGPYYGNPQGSVNVEDLPWRKIAPDDTATPPAGTVTKVGEPNP
jgi:hypothetical protein